MVKKIGNEIESRRRKLIKFLKKLSALVNMNILSVPVNET
jgi:hypothetical protein